MAVSTYVESSPRQWCGRGSRVSANNLGAHLTCLRTASHHVCRNIDQWVVGQLQDGTTYKVRDSEKDGKGLYGADEYEYAPISELSPLWELTTFHLEQHTIANGLVEIRYRCWIACVIGPNSHPVRAIHARAIQPVIRGYPKILTRRQCQNTRQRGTHL